MNALTVLSLAALASCSRAHLLGYPGVLGLHGAAYPGLLHHGYYGGLPLKAPITYKSVTAAPAAIPAVAPVAPVSPVVSQYHAQDELGRYSFGYAGGPSSRAETRDAFGVVRGSYNYVDADGKVQTQHYVADALGFRVSATNLPVAPGAPKVPAVVAHPGPLPVAVADTAEVAAAKAAFKKTYDEAAAAAAAAPDSRKKRSLVAPAALTPYSPLHFSHGYSAPLAYAAHHVPYTAAHHHALVGSHLPYTSALPAVTAYSAPAAAVRDAELLRVIHNPGHAVSYRVY